ncbi:MAG: FAD-dependent oxidoreductase, partial [Miltoncostaeaceae bacterium]
MSDPIVVVGSGIAGALFAIHAAERADVLALSRPGAVGSTPWAQGGIAAAIDPADSPESHVDDTVASGAGLVDRSAASSMCADAPRSIQELVDLGVAFDREADGRLSLGREGAHSTRRVVHADGDSTGAR